MCTLHHALLATGFALATIVAGCSSSTKTAPASGSKADGGAADGGATSTKARPKTKPRTASLKSKAGPTPPAGATSKGRQTKPKAGALTLPLVDTEVFTFQEVLDEGGASTTINWARVETGTTYLWASNSVTCDDGSTDPNAAFLMEVGPDGAGSWVFSLPGCPAGDLFGCDFDEAGEETTCGACALDGEALVCAAGE